MGLLSKRASPRGSWRRCKVKAVAKRLGEVEINAFLSHLATDEEGERLHP